MNPQEHQLPTKTVVASFFILLGIFLVSGLQNADTRNRISQLSLEHAESNILKLAITSDAADTAGGDREAAVSDAGGADRSQSVVDVPLVSHTAAADENKKEGSVEAPVIEEQAKQPLSQAQQLLPLRNWNIEPFETAARSAIVTDINAEKIIYQKNIDQRLSIASLTKLMTAWIVSENTQPGDSVTITKNAVAAEGEHGKLFPDEKITVKDLSAVMLIPSSNDAAVAFQDHFRTIGKNLIALMNDKAGSLELRNTHFSNPAGLDAADHYSSSYDLAKIISAMKEKNDIWETSVIRDTTVRSSDGTIAHHLINTNDLLMIRDDILGGKTGSTPQANGCLSLILRLHDKEFIFIILGSDNRFDDMQRLIEWVTKAFIFE